MATDVKKISLLLGVILLCLQGCADIKSADSDGGENQILPSESEALFPHPDGWAEPTSHGEWVRQNGLQACLNCHKEDSYKKNDTPPTCHSCHPLFPHEKEWGTKELHGETVLRNGKAFCTGCHGADLQGGLSQISCHQCHPIYPHSSDWKNPSRHGKTVEETGKKLCVNCHGSDAPQKFFGESCHSCHAIYPHPSSWVEDHKTKALGIGLSTCQACHGTDFKNVLNGKTCFSCHQSYPHTDPRWATGFGHGRYFSSQFKSPSTEAECWDCHGSPIPFNGTQTREELKNQSFCYQCHWAYPHKRYETANGPKDWGVATFPPGLGHLYYLIQSDLLLDSRGSHPTTNDNDPWLIPAVRATCGGSTEGSCHVNGNRSEPADHGTKLCGGYCHKR
ncbi:MAG: hypothetical protein HYS22_07970 [Deltaproteobacteria bacterium]|nr:hypothetical protein [Deltaproteobacteria bacterium]